MTIGTMTSKGQITIPKDVREDLGLQPGSTVGFEKNEDGSYTLRIARSRNIMDLAGSIPYDGPPLSVEEMDEAIAAGAAEGNK